MNYMFGYIYIIVNKINGRYYIGQKSGEFDPGYWGSPSVKSDYLKDFNKLGKKYFHREIIAYASCRQELDILEIKAINKRYIEDKKCYNLSPGGYGWAQINKLRTKEEFSKYGKLGAKKSSAIAKEKAKKRHKERLDKYNLNKNKCRICKNYLEFEKRDRKTCSSKCLSLMKSQNNKKRIVTEETREKIRDSLKNRISKKGCSNCGTLKKKKNSNMCSLCYLEYRKSRFEWAIEDIISMRYQGATYQQIADSVGCSHPIASKIFKLYS